MIQCISTHLWLVIDIIIWSERRLRREILLLILVVVGDWHPTATYRWVDSASLLKRDLPVWFSIMCINVNIWNFDIKIISWRGVILKRPCVYPPWYYIESMRQLGLYYILRRVAIRHWLTSYERNIALELWSILSTRYLVCTKV